MKLLLLLNPLTLMFISCITSSSSSSSSSSYALSTGNSLQNPSFENVTTNGTSRFSLLHRTSSNIQGWSFAGTVYYVSSGHNSSFPESDGHAIQLAQNGIINQTHRIRATDGYVVSFNLAMPNPDCADHYNHTPALNITIYETSINDFHQERSEVFFYHGRNFSRRPWETNAFLLGRMGNGDRVNIEVKSVMSTMIDINCWPLVDVMSTIIIGTNKEPSWEDQNMVSNGDFEVGPSLLKNSFEGILLNSRQKSTRYEFPHEEKYYSPLQEWSIHGTIRYQDSKHYIVPQGKAAIELLSESGGQSGIEIDLYLSPTLYTLNFTMGDANDSCIGEFVLYLQIGQNEHNFMMSSYGNGSFSRRSITFKGEPSSNVLDEGVVMTFSVFNETRTSDGVLCGPVLDSIVLVASSYVERVINVHIWVSIICFLCSCLFLQQKYSIYISSLKV